MLLGNHNSSETPPPSKKKAVHVLTFGQLNLSRGKPAQTRFALAGNINTLSFFPYVLKSLEVRS